MGERENILNITGKKDIIIRTHRGSNIHEMFRKQYTSDYFWSPGKDENEKSRSSLNHRGS